MYGELIRERRRHIRDMARCDNCGSTFISCLAARGKDPEAPPWFGCCASGPYMDPCHHTPDRQAFNTLLDEVETGEIRSLDQVLLDSIQEYPRSRRALLCWIDDCGCDGKAHR